MYAQMPMSAPDPAKPALQDTLALLSAAARGLLFPSESDFPFDTIELNADPSDEGALREALGIQADLPIEELAVGDLFQPVIESCEGSEADQYKEIVSIFEGILSGSKVIRAGRVEIDVFVVGKHDSGVWIGLKTKVVET